MTGEVRVGIIGGSGLYQMEGLTDVQELEIPTPFGTPSDNYRIGTLEGQRVVFLARHNRNHTIMPSELNFRANIYGFKQLGVEWIISASAVGSLKGEHRPLDIVLPDQFYDRTKTRISTFFGEGVVVHVSFADPICSQLAGVVQQAGADAAVPIKRGGTYVCMEGPQFSTKAESNTYRSWGMDLIGMTNLQEAKLAREAEICYTTMALVTDYDCWHPAHDAVTVAEVVQNLKKNAENAQKIIRAAVKRLPIVRTCSCRNALQNAILTDLSKGAAKDKNQVGALTEEIHLRINIFFNDRHELRSGWKLAVYFATFILIWVAAGIALSLWFVRAGLADDQLTALALNELALLIPAVIAPLMVVRFVDHRPLKTFGITLQNCHRDLLRGLALSAAMVGMVFGGSYIFGYVHTTWTANQVPAATLVGTAAVLIIAAAVEELMFRGLPLQILCEGIGKWPGILVFSGLFGAVHLSNPNSTLLGAVNTILAGVLLSLAYFKARSLWLPYAIHLGWNAGIGFVLGMSLSGLDLASLWTTGVAGRDLILGGSYGPEGGLLMTFTFGVSALFMNRRNSN